MPLFARLFFEIVAMLRLLKKKKIHIKPLKFFSLSSSSACVLRQFILLCCEFHCGCGAFTLVFFLSLAIRIFIYSHLSAACRLLFLLFSLTSHIDASHALPSQLTLGCCMEKRCTASNERKNPTSRVWESEKNAYDSQCGLRECFCIKLNYWSPCSGCERMLPCYVWTT